MPACSRMAQMLVVPLLVEWKTKYRSSAVQLPQHSPAGLFQPGSSGCGLEPSAATSHSETDLVLVSCTEKRNRLPSGDQRGQYGLPRTVTNSWELVPSLLALYNVEPLA